ncbi:MAG: amidohydrolase family protein [Gammaproteobacteria bacterium]|nr:amidohydrolase family protein [Gammaproteobacteria bacterium]
MKKLIRIVCYAGAILCVTACATSGNPIGGEPAADNADDYQSFVSTYQAPQSAPLVVRNVRALTGTGSELESVDLVVENGKISALTAGAAIPDGATEVDGTGKWLTPGIIDVHSHMGVYPNPGIKSHSDGNEAVAPNTAEVWAEHSVWPQDPNFEKAIAGGVTTAQILPGSANLFGGRGVVLKIVPSITMLGMKFPDAPHSLKMACGENPKRVYGEKGGPATRMGNMAGYRKAWIEAGAYRKSWEDYHSKVARGDKAAVAPLRDLKMETLVGVLNGEINVHNHCYRADEMANMIELSREFGYSISAFHHAVEAYKVADLLAENDICAAVWADWWGFKQEAFDMIRENAALIHYAKGCAIIHSDDEIQIQRLTQEAAKVIGAARQMGMEIERGQAIRWVTANPAKSLGLADRIGSLEVGKNADIVLWSGDPFSVYSTAEKVWIDGVLRYEKGNPMLPPTSDFNLGILRPAEDRS